MSGIVLKDSRSLIYYVILWLGFTNNYILQRRKIRNRLPVRNRVPIPVSESGF